MPNYVRACFCVAQPIEDAALQALLKILDIYEFRSVDVSVALPSVGTLDLAWTLSDRRISARFLQIWHPNSDQGMISFDVDADLFLPGRTISVNPAHDKLFSIYKSILVQIVTHINPVIGLFDYEADLLCPIALNHSLAYWGNYFSNAWLKHWSLEDRGQLEQIADELVTIEALGILTFIHPLAANQAWTERHKKLEELIRRYP